MIWVCPNRFQERTDQEKSPGAICRPTSSSRVIGKSRAAQGCELYGPFRLSSGAALGVSSIHFPIVHTGARNDGGSQVGSERICLCVINGDGKMLKSRERLRNSLDLLQKSREAIVSAEKLLARALRKDELITVEFEDTSRDIATHTITQPSLRRFTGPGSGGESAIQR